MKTFVLKVVSQNRAIKGGLIHLTENITGNVQIEGECLHASSGHLKAIMMAGIDACVYGYDDPMNKQEDVYVEAV